MLTAEFAAGYATGLHRGQTEKDGAPYVGHLTRVAGMVPRPYKALAWMHDTVEDCALTDDELAAVGADPEFIVDLHLLSKPEGLVRPPYVEWVRHICDSKRSRPIVVKCADVKDHLRPGHEDVLNHQQIGKYQAALVLLDQTLVRLRREAAAELIVWSAIDCGRWRAQGDLTRSDIVRARDAVLGDPQYRDDLLHHTTTRIGMEPDLADAAKTLSKGPR